MPSVVKDLASSAAGDFRVFENASHFKQSFVELAELRQSRHLCDVVIKVETKELHCHRVVLAASIPYFKSMFCSDMKESRSPEVFIKDVAPDAMELLLDYAYTGKLLLTTETVQPILYAASILQMDVVCSACEDFITHFLTMTNCLAIRQFAQQHNCVQLMREVDSFTEDCFANVVSMEDFLQVTLQHLLDLISSDDLNVANEQEIFDTVVRWCGHDPEERLVLFPQLLARVRLCQLTSGCLLNDVKDHQWIRVDFYVCKSDRGLECENPLCSQIVADAMACQMVNANMAHMTAHCADLRQCRPRKSVAGVIFCVGGRGTTGDPFKSIEAYDLRKNIWIPVPEMGTQRRHVGVVSAGGKLYAIGGHDGTEHLSSAEVFNPATNSWSQVASMTTQRRGIAMAYLGGAIYAVGGLDDSACFNTVERYDIEANCWAAVAAMTVQRGGVGVGALKGHLYAVGGNDGSSSLDSCERYNPYLNKWSVVAPMSHRRAGAGVVVLGGNLYAIGGFDDNAPLKSCEKFDPESNSWKLIPPMSCPRGGVGVAALGGRIYAVGGHDGYSYLDSVEAYDPVTESWEPVASISHCRAGAGVAWCDCSVLKLQNAPSFNVAACV